MSGVDRILLIRCNETADLSAFQLLPLVVWKCRNSVNFCTSVIILLSTWSGESTLSKTNCFCLVCHGHKMVYYFRWTLNLIVRSPITSCGYTGIVTPGNRTARVGGSTCCWFEFTIVTILFKVHSYYNCFSIFASITFVRLYITNKLQLYHFR